MLASIKVFDNIEDKEGYARALGKPVLLMGTGLDIIGIAVVAIPGVYAIFVSLSLLLLMVIFDSVWFVKILKKF